MQWKNEIEAFTDGIKIAIWHGASREGNISELKKYNVVSAIDIRKGLGKASGFASWLADLCAYAACSIIGDDTSPLFYVPFYVQPASTSATR